MTTSGGGGFCDCGDAEAWKKGPYCQKHTPTAPSRDTEEVRNTPVCLSLSFYVRLLFSTSLSLDEIITVLFIPVRIL